MEKTSQNIAIFGGSFDPVHLGHLHLAEIIREEYALDKIIFMPLGLPPHKKQSAASNEHRYKMALIATCQNPYFSVSRLDLDRGGYTYTVDTLNDIKKELPPKSNLYFIIGADSLVNMHTWKEPGELFKLCQIIAISRPGITNEKAKAAGADLERAYGAKIHLLKRRTYPISSTEIRRLAGKGLSIRYFVSGEVYEYINEHGLYPRLTDPKIVKKYLKANLSRERVAHSLRTADVCAYLAEIHGEDTDKAYLAGLLHDIAKELPKSEREKHMDCSDDNLLLYPETAHAFIGASVAKEEFNIEDSDVLNAIRYHTTARPLMSNIEKIVFIADKIEEGRRFEEAGYLTALAEEDLDKALTAILQITTSIAKDEGKNIHPLSLKVLRGY